jgi:hypothetical protein
VGNILLFGGVNGLTHRQQSPYHIQMPAKFMRCVKKVKLKGVGNPWAICRVSTGFKGSTHYQKKKLLGAFKK